ncbi:MAG: Mrp/NBP35 family ATP-binding protein [Pseudomonadota bacterium]
MTNAPTSTFFTPPKPLNAIKHIICVASCKGGVGKSTIAVNLALALKQNGHSVGLLDADLYGPSLPQMLDLNTGPKLNEQNKIIPFDRFGILCMSMGVLIPQESALVWRGLMIQKALSQLLLDVEWGELDILVIDMPPGTGDPYLTLAKKIHVSGAVIVSTPQELALLDVRKGVQMFEKLNIPVLGFVENMSYFICDSCDKKHTLFDTGGAAREAKKLGYPLLGEIPLNPLVRITADQSSPIVTQYPEHHISLMYANLANATWAQIQNLPLNAGSVASVAVP